MSRDLTADEERVLTALRPVFEAHDRAVQALEEMHDAFQQAIGALSATTGEGGGQ